MGAVAMVRTGNGEVEDHAKGRSSLDRIPTGHPGLLIEGRLDVAIRQAATVVERSEERDANGLAVVEARLVLAEGSFERNELDTAQMELESALQVCHVEGATDWMWVVEVDLIRTMVAQGRAREALHRLDHLRNVAQAGAVHLCLPPRLNEAEVDCRIVLGDIDGASLVARSSPPGQISLEMLARLDLASGRPDRALTRLGAGGSPDQGRCVRRCILRACAEQQRGHQQRAEAAIRLAVEMARPPRHIRPFLEQAAQALPLVGSISALSPEPFISEITRQAQHLVASPDLMTRVAMLEPLTERERQVLGYLPSHLTLPQIAMVLCVSTNTVKTYVKNIHRKIGATSRHEAVLVARQFGLV